MGDAGTGTLRSLKSPGIIVRPFEPSDAPSFLAAVKASLPELTYWMPWCKESYGINDAEAWISFAQTAWDNRSEFPLGIFDASNGEVIGGTGVNHINKSDRIGNIGYWISTPFVGQGIATSAARYAADLGFAELGLTRQEIIALTHNLASQRVAERLGAMRECVARNRLYLQGKPHDAVVFSLVRDDLST